MGYISVAAAITSLWDSTGSMQDAEITVFTGSRECCHNCPCGFSFQIHKKRIKLKFNRPNQLSIVAKLNRRRRYFPRADKTVRAVTPRCQTSKAQE